MAKKVHVSTTIVGSCAALAFLFLLVVSAALVRAQSSSNSPSAQPSLAASPAAASAVASPSAQPTKNPSKPHHHYDVRHQPKIHHPTQAPD